MKIFEIAEQFNSLYKMSEEILNKAYKTLQGK